MASKPRSQIRWNNKRMLWTIFQGSKPIAASTTPTRIDSRISRNATVSGEPPRKRLMPSPLAGNSRVSLAIVISRADVSAHSSIVQGKWGIRLAPSTALGLAHPLFRCWACYMNSCSSRIGFEHPLQRFQPVGLAQRLVPAQPVDARKPHRDAGFMPWRARQSLEGYFQHEALIRLMHHMPDRPEFLGGVAAHEAIDLQQFLVGEAEIGLADRHQLFAVLACGPDSE